MTNFLLDNFADGVINSNRIITAGEAAITESGGRLNTPASQSGGYVTMCFNNTQYDLMKGRLAVRLTKSGSNNADVYTYIGIRDTTGRMFTMNAKTSDATLWFAVDQLGSSVSMTNNDTTVGMGPSWTNNTYVGYSYVSSTRTFTISKSTDLVNWTPIRTIVITNPVFDFRHVGVVMGASNFTGGASSYVAGWDDLTYVATDSAMRVKVRSGGAWVLASVKMRTASNTWVKVLPRVRKSGDWYMPEGS